MSVLRDLATKRFWLSVVTTVGVALLLCAVGAYAAVCGLLKMEWVSWWICLVWICGACAGSRYIAAQRDGVLPRGLLTTGVALGLLWLLGLTTGGGQSVQTQTQWWYICAALLGVLLAAILPHRKRKRSNKKGREAQRVTRGR